MSKDFILITFTVLFLIIAILIIVLVVVVQKTKSDAYKRDLYYAKRFDDIEEIVRNNFTQIINILKQ